MSASFVKIITNKYYLIYLIKSSALYYFSQGSSGLLGQDDCGHEVPAIILGNPGLPYRENRTFGSAIFIFMTIPV
jgi:hypothetical protein